MNDTPSSKQRKIVRHSKEQREQWVAKFKRSGLTARDFAQKNGLSYSALCRWNKATKPQEFVEVHCQTPALPMEIGLGSEVRVTIHSQEQVDWVSDLIRKLRRSRSC
jgi:hypothetical protein